MSLDLLLVSLMKSNSYFAHETAVIDRGATIGAGAKIWHFCHVMSGAKIGENCSLGQNVMVANNVEIGNGVKIQNNVSVYEGVTVEDDVFIGPSVVFTNVKNPRSFIDRKKEFKKTIIHKGASIGANVTVLCGNTIGKYALIGAGSVVTKNVGAYSLVIGNPMKQVGWVSEFGHALDFDMGEITTCPESGQTYRLLNNQVFKLDNLISYEG